MVQSNAMGSFGQREMLINSSIGTRFAVLVQSLVLHKECVNEYRREFLRFTNDS